jgi:hypothetical protein
MTELAPFADVPPIADGDTMIDVMKSSDRLSMPAFVAAPASLRMAGGVASVLAIAIGCAAAAFALMASPESLWAAASLQSLVVMGGCFGLAWSRGRFLTGPVLALLCAAGSVMVGGALSFVAHRGSLGPVDMKWWALSEVALALLLAFFALGSAVARDPESRVPAVKGALLTCPALLALLVLFAGPRLGVLGALASMPTWVTMALWTVLGFVVSVMLCMAAHYLGEAFSRAAKAGRIDTSR